MTACPTAERAEGWGEARCSKGTKHAKHRARIQEETKGNRIRRDEFFYRSFQAHPRRWPFRFAFSTIPSDAAARSVAVLSSCCLDDDKRAGCL